MTELSDVKVTEIGEDDSAMPAATVIGGSKNKDLPDWVVVPENMTMPTGKRVTFLRFRTALTDRSDLGDRQVMIWNLSVKDERLARSRIQVTSGAAVYEELAKQMFRAIDGNPVNWAEGGTVIVERFWDEIGPKYRGALVNWYMREHSLTDEERLDFFVNCAAVRSVK